MTSETRWTARPILAAGLRSVAFFGPMALSSVIVVLALALLPLGGASVPVLIGSWVAVGVFATVAMLIADRWARRLLPIAALMRLSLVLPDDMPSRFAAASRRLTPEELEHEIAHARAGSPGDSSSEAAARLLRLVAELADHDALTRGHSDRVRAYSQIIGQSLGLSEDDLDRLNWAALLHDVGKMAVPGEVLNKRGRPNDEEWELLKAHAEEGARMAEPLREWLGDWFPAIAEHHERWDGTGYPAGLAGEDISLAGRIVAVADSYDVMTSDRSYASARSRPDALEELAACSGTHFDPAIVRAMFDASAGMPRVAYGSGAWLGPLPVLGRLASLPSIAPGTASSILASAAIVGAGTLAPGTLSAAATLVAPPAPPPVSSSAESSTAPDGSVPIDVAGDRISPGEDGDSSRSDDGAVGDEGGPDVSLPFQDGAAGGTVPFVPGRGESEPTGGNSGGGSAPGDQGGSGGGDSSSDPTPPDDPGPVGPGDPPKKRPTVVRDVVDTVKTVAPPVVKDVVDTVEAVAPPVVKDVVDTVEAVAPPVVKDVVDGVGTLVPTEPSTPPPSVQLPAVPPVKVPPILPGGRASAEAGGGGDPQPPGVSLPRLP